MSGIAVRAAEPGDAEAIAAIYQSEAVLANTAQVPHRGEAFWRDFYKQRDPNGVELVAVADGRAVGHLGLLTNSSPRRRHVASFGIAVHPEFQGSGIGSALMAEMVRLADEWLNLVRIELVVAAENTAAIRLYEKFGFVTEGVGRWEIFTGGKYADCRHMARVRGVRESRLS